MSHAAECVGEGESANRSARGDRRQRIARRAPSTLDVASNKGMVASLTPHDAAKQRELEALLSQPIVDTWKLRELALRPGGLVNDEIRKIVWPKLVGVSVDGQQDDEDDEQHRIRKLAEAAAAAAAPWTGSTGTPSSSGGIPASSSSHSRRSTGRGSSQKGVHNNGGDDDNREVDDDDDDDDASSFCSEETSTTLSSRVDVDTIERDVLRCTTHLLPPALLPHLHDGRVRALLRNQQERLAHLINKVLMSNDGFWYYQGYHDVSSVFLATLGKKVSLRRDWASEDDAGPGGEAQLPYEVLSSVSRHFFRDFLHNNFGHLQTALRLTVFPLLARIDPDLHDLLFEVDIPCSFCLPWVLTWFAREGGVFTHRIFDACLASHPLFCLYLSVALVTHPHNRAVLLTSEPDFSVLHNRLRSLPKNTFGESSYDDDDTDHWADDPNHDDDRSVWDTRTLDEGWLHQKIQQQHKYPHDEVRLGHEMLPVPLEEVIHGALEAMRLIPPHQLLDLAERYYRVYGGRFDSSSLSSDADNHHNNGDGRLDDADGKLPREMHDLLVDVPDIYFFRNNHLFKWEAVPYQDAGLSPDSIAVVAAGLAEGTLRRNRRRRKRRQRALLAAAAVALLSAGLYVFRNPQSQPVRQGDPLSVAASKSKRPLSIPLENVQVVAEVDRHDLEGVHNLGGDDDADVAEDNDGESAVATNSLSAAGMSSGVCAGSECPSSSGGIPVVDMN